MATVQRPSSQRALCLVHSARRFSPVPPGLICPRLRAGGCCLGACTVALLPLPNVDHYAKYPIARPARLSSALPPGRVTCQDHWVIRPRWLALALAGGRSTLVALCSSLGRCTVARPSAGLAPGLAAGWLPSTHPTHNAIATRVEYFLSPSPT